MISRQGLKYTYLSKLKLKSDGIGGQGAAKASKRRKQVLKQGTSSKGIQAPRSHQDPLLQQKKFSFHQHK